MATKKKNFDALAASRRWRRKTSRTVRDMTSEERRAFFNRRLQETSQHSVATPALELAHR